MKFALFQKPFRKFLPPTTGYRDLILCICVLFISFSGKSAEVYLKPELVGFGCQLVDEIQDVHPPVSFYVYQCIIKCWETGERIVSNSVKLPVSTYTLPDKSLPEFKIALLICQEEYDYQVQIIFRLQPSVTTIRMSFF